MALIHRVRVSKTTAAPQRRAAGHAPSAMGLDVPTTIALARGSLWAVNARFTTPPTPTTPYWITRVDLHD